MHASKLVQRLLISVCLFSLASCTVVDKIHVYFNSPSEKADYTKLKNNFEYLVANRNERLSDVAFKLTGSRNVKAIRAANPEIQSENLTKGTVVYVPVELLKPVFRNQLKEVSKPPPVAPVATPRPQGKVINKIKEPGGRGNPTDEEILPGEQNSLEQFEAPLEEEKQAEKNEYDETPFKPDKKVIIPYEPPANKQKAEEERLRNKYRDIMSELD